MISLSRYIPKGNRTSRWQTTSCVSLVLY